MFVPINWIFATLSVEICQYHDAILYKIYLEDISSVESLIFYRFPC